MFYGLHLNIEIYDKWYKINKGDFLYFWYPYRYYGKQLDELKTENSRLKEQIKELEDLQKQQSII